MICAWDLRTLARLIYRRGEVSRDTAGQVGGKKGNGGRTEGKLKWLSHGCHVDKSAWRWHDSCFTFGGKKCVSSFIINIESVLQMQTQYYPSEVKFDWVVLGWKVIPPASNELQDMNVLHSRVVWGNRDKALGFKALIEETCFNFNVFSISL